MFSFFSSINESCHKIKSMPSANLQQLFIIFTGKYFLPPGVVDKEKYGLAADLFHLFEDG